MENKNRIKSKNFKWVGDLVWLFRKRPKEKFKFQITNKMDWSLYRIVEITSPVTVLLQTLNGKTMNYSVHVSKLKFYKESKFCNDERNLKKNLEDGIEIHEVEEILDVREEEKGLKYLIKWKDFSSEENTWEPEKYLDNCEEKLKLF
jgi:hypothetical protein